MRRFIGLFVDLLLITAATFAAVVLRNNLEVPFDQLKGILPYTFFTAGFAVVTLILLGADRVLWRFSTLNDYMRLVLATIVIVAGSCVCSFVFNRLEFVPRALPLLQGILMAVLLIGVRVISRLHHASRAAPAPAMPSQRMPSVSGSASTVLVVGLTRLTDLYIRSAAEFAPRTIRIAGLLGQKERFTGSSVHQHTVLGTPEEVESIVRNLEVHGVFVDSIVVAKRFEALSPKSQQALLQLEASTSIRLIFLPESLGFEGGTGKDRDRPGDGVSSPSSETAAFVYSDKDIDNLNARAYWRIKRLIDVSVASAMVLVAAPLMLIVALLVAIDIGSPVTFWQQRPGRGGRPIHLYKFRTMGSAHDSKGKRIPDEHRISLIGRFLRRTRLDELPQLFSIISGDMSFVGPRPLLPVDQSPEYAARLLVPPGLTGWAQVNGGREVSAADKAALDVWYVQNASFMLDLRIILRTIPMIVFGERMSPRDIQRAWSELQEAGICKPGAFSQLAAAGNAADAGRKHAA